MNPARGPRPGGPGPHVLLAEAVPEPFECPDAAIAPPAPTRAKTATTLTAMRRVMVTCISSTPFVDDVSHDAAAA
jgi:hypothetical protein